MVIVFRPLLLGLRLPSQSSSRVYRLNLRTMASTPSLDLLPSPLKDLVISACTQDEHYGSSDTDKSEVSDWIQKVAKGDIAQPSSAKVRSHRP